MTAQHAVSTPDASRVCVHGEEDGRAYCGRRHTNPAKFTSGGKPMNCSDCAAALRADGRLA